MSFDKRGKIIFSSRILWPPWPDYIEKIGNTDAKICRQIFLQAYLKGKTTNAVVPDYKGR